MEEQKYLNNASESFFIVMLPKNSFNSRTVSSLILQFYVSTSNDKVYDRQWMKKLFYFPAFTLLYEYVEQEKEGNKKGIFEFKSIWIEGSGDKQRERKFTTNIYMRDIYTSQWSLVNRKRCVITLNEVKCGVHEDERQTFNQK